MVYSARDLLATGTNHDIPLPAGMVALVAFPDCGINTGRSLQCDQGNLAIPIQFDQSLIKASKSFFQLLLSPAQRTIEQKCTNGDERCAHRYSY